MPAALEEQGQETSLYSKEEIQSIRRQSVPRHIAIIMDGNRRWAHMQELPTVAGYWAGAEALMSAVEAAKTLGVETLTVYAFSTENWRRPKEEIDAVFALIEAYLLQQKERMIREEVRLGTIGDLRPLPESLLMTLADIKEATACYQKVNLVIALNYGARNEMCRSLQQILADCQQGKLSSSDLTEERISASLDTAPWGDPDLLIRSGGQQRLSNFLLWQLSYSEVYITDTLWPDFDAAHLLAAVREYQDRQRRYGA